jgi:8-oxo-dGTP pyrophosphatase MutT (NUDIX family)
VRRVSRQSGRSLLVDDDCRVLLIGVTDPTDGAEVWVTPGGEVEDGEDIPTAAARELLEETGLSRTVDDIGRCVAVAQGDFEFGGKLISTVDHFFFIRCVNFDLDDTGWTDFEREVHTDWRWWTCDELDTTDKAVFPAGLSDLVRDLFVRGPGSEPVELRWIRR